MSTHTHCDFCDAEIPNEVPSKTILVSIDTHPGSRPAVSPIQLKKDACYGCGDQIRRILTLVDGKQIKKILESITHR